MSRALLFDAYGTLFDVQSVLARCEALWPGKGARLSPLWRAKQLEYTWLRSLMGRYVPFSQITREALQFACQFLDLKLDRRKTETLMDDYLNLSPYPEVAETLNRLQGRKLAILTNGSPDMIGPLVKNRGMEKTFASVLSVDELKIYKPAPQVYRLAVERLGIPAAQIGFVSSNCWDALGAKSFGFEVWWINRNAAPVDRMGIEPDRIVGNLGEIR